MAKNKKRRNSRIEMANRKKVTREVARPEHMDYRLMADSEILQMMGNGDWNLGWEKHPGICVTAVQRQMILEEVLKEFSVWAAYGITRRVRKAGFGNVRLSSESVELEALRHSNGTLGDWVNEYTGDIHTMSHDGIVERYWMVYGDVIHDMLHTLLLHVIWDQSSHPGSVAEMRAQMGQLLSENTNLIAMLRGMWTLVCQMPHWIVMTYVGDFIDQLREQLRVSQQATVTEKPKVITAPVLEFCNHPLDSVLNRWEEFVQGG